MCSSTSSRFLGGGRLCSRGKLGLCGDAFGSCTDGFLCGGLCILDGMNEDNAKKEAKKKRTSFALASLRTLGASFTFPEGPRSVDEDKVRTAG